MLSSPASADMGEMQKEGEEMTMMATHCSHESSTTPCMDEGAACSALCTHCACACGHLSVPQSNFDFHLPGWAPAAHANPVLSLLYRATPPELPPPLA